MEFIGHPVYAPEKKIVKIKFFTEDEDHFTLNVSKPLMKVKIVGSAVMTRPLRFRGLIAKIRNL